MTIPAQPQNIVLQTGNGQNLLSWDNSIGASSYSIQRSIDGVNFIHLGTASQNYYIDSAVTVGTNYFYQVASTNESGTSTYAIPYPVSITPCLPGQINLGYLRYMAQLQADKLNSDYLTTDEWNWNINQSATELYDILVTKFGDNYFLAPPLYINLTGVQDYALPDGSNYPVNGINSPALYKLSGADANISGGAITGTSVGWIPMSRFNWSDRDKYSIWPGQAGTLNNLYSLSYRQMGSRLEIIPANTQQTIRLWYIPVLKQMLLDTDMMPFSISGWSEYVVVDAGLKAMGKEESFEKVQYFLQRKAMLMERIETAAANRDVDQSNTVSNVRSTMGDPGFGGWGMGGFGYGAGGFGGGGY